MDVDFAAPKDYVEAAIPPAAAAVEVESEAVVGGRVNSFVSGEIAVIYLFRMCFPVTEVV